MTEYERKAVTYAARKTLEMFEGRKGHGGGPCTRRVLSPREIRALLAEAFLDGANERHAQR